MADSCVQVLHELFEAFSVCRLLIQSWICRRRITKVRRKNHGGNSRRKKFQNFRSQLAEALASGDKGSCFELLVLDEEDVWYSLSIASLALLPFEAVTVTVSCGFPARFLRVRSFVFYSMSKLRLFSNRKELNRRDYFLNLGSQSLEFRRSRDFLRKQHLSPLCNWFELHFHKFWVIILWHRKSARKYIFPPVSKEKSQRV